MKNLLAVSALIAASAAGTAHADVYCGAGFIKSIGVNAQKDTGNGVKEVTNTYFNLDDSVAPPAANPGFGKIGGKSYIVVSHYIDPNYYGLQDVLNTAFASGAAIGVWATTSYNCGGWDNGFQVILCDSQTLDACKPTSALQDPPRVQNPPKGAAR